jgi:hypothetical protein
VFNSEGIKVTEEAQYHDQTPRERRNADTPIGYFGAINLKEGSDGTTECWNSGKVVQKQPEVNSFPRLCYQQRMGTLWWQHISSALGGAF